LKKIKRININIMSSLAILEEVEPNPNQGLLNNDNNESNLDIQIDYGTVVDEQANVANNDDNQSQMGESVLFRDFQ
jgi:hypothetical protein